MSNEQSQSNIRDRIELREPHKWAVIFWNDDFTTMDFVIHVLTEIFLKSAAEAERLTLEVHQHGQAIVGVYSYDIAVSRTQTATQAAREAGFPLKITYKKA